MIYSAQFCKITICGRRICTVGCFVIGFEGAREFAKAIEGATKDVKK